MNPDGLIHIGLFDGIGGFSLAAELKGWETLVLCEIEKFNQKVLKYYWPDAYHHADIHTLTYETIQIELSKRYGEGWRNRPIILTGGFPCQPFSTARERRGKEDERHLWPQMYRCIKEIRPRWVVGENVHGIVNWNGGMVFDEVCNDLEDAGYAIQSFVIPACSQDAPHRRDRVWFIAHTDNSDEIRRAGENEGTRGGKGVSKRNKVQQPIEPSQVHADVPNLDVDSKESPGKGRKTKGGRRQYHGC